MRHFFYFALEEKAKKFAENKMLIQFCSMQKSIDFSGTVFAEYCSEKELNDKEKLEIKRLAREYGAVKVFLNEH